MRTATLSLLLATAVVAATAACGKDEPDPAPAPDPAAAPKPRSNIVKITTPIPYGAKLACADLFDPATAAAAIGDVVEVRDRSTSDADASAVCAFMRTGEPPTSNEQLKKFEKENMVLGVLPGDEYCMVAAFCGFILSDEDMKKTCSGADDRADDSLGQFACVHETQRATKYAYRYTVLDPDSKCKLEVQGGPSVTDEDLVQKCTRLGLDSITAENIKKFKM